MESVEHLSLAQHNPQLLSTAHTHLSPFLKHASSLTTHTYTHSLSLSTHMHTLSLLPLQGCLLVSDALNHASIVVGARGSGAKIKVFRHNDAEHLDDVLRCSIAEGQPRSHRPWKKVRGKAWNEGERGVV